MSSSVNVWTKVPWIATALNLWIGPTNAGTERRNKSISHIKGYIKISSCTLQTASIGHPPLFTEHKSAHIVFDNTSVVN